MDKDFKLHDLFNVCCPECGNLFELQKTFYHPRHVCTKCGFTVENKWKKDEVDMHYAKFNDAIATLKKVKEDYAERHKKDDI